jgi:hypothetical protein
MGTWLQNWFAPLKRTLPARIWQPLRTLGTAVVTPVRFSVTSGHWRSSWAMASCSRDGSPIPWYTYPAIDFLAQRNYVDRRILEFGGGQSTLWWSARAREVLTFEEDAEWFRRIHVTIQHVSFHNISESIDRIRELIDCAAKHPFDVIVVDGGPRRELTALAFDYLANGGAIILDNAEGYGFYEETKWRKCRRIDFFGFAPGVSLRHCTSVIFLNDCFLLQPDLPISYLEQLAAGQGAVPNVLRS